MKIGLSLAKVLFGLRRGEEVPFSSFSGSNRKIIQKCLDDGVLEEMHIGTQQKKIVCKSSNVLDNFLHNQFGITSLEEYIILHEDDTASRSDAVKVASDSKSKTHSLLEGFMVNCYDEIIGTLHGKHISLRPDKGSFLFINQYQQFTIPDDVTVVGVEAIKIVGKIKTTTPRCKLTAKFTYIDVQSFGIKITKMQVRI